ncbi:TRAP transporter substrate-binding protein DctP [bacterium]|nr:TRAP transporter substrate-binding protein DctP [bacterium]
MNKRLLLIGMVIFLLIGLLVSTSGLAASASKARPIVLKHVTFIPKTSTHIMIDVWMEKIAERSNGAISFKYLGGPEVIPGREQFEACRKGLIDSASIAATWTTGVVPESEVMGATRKRSVDLRRNGFFDLMNEIYNKQNVHYFMQAESFAFTDGIRLFTKSKITGLKDLKGLKIAVTNKAAEKLCEKFGASGVWLGTQERYTALERGVVTGALSPFSGSFFKHAYYEVLKYYIQPGFGRGSMGLYINLDKWNAIPPDLQKLMVDTALEIEKEWEPKWVDFHGKMGPKANSSGMELITLSPEDGKAFKDAFYEIAWNQIIIPSSPKYGTKLRELSGN